MWLHACHGHCLVLHSSPPQSVILVPMSSNIRDSATQVLPRLFLLPFLLLLGMSPSRSRALPPPHSKHILPAISHFVFSSPSNVFHKYKHAILRTSPDRIGPRRHGCSPLEPLPLAWAWGSMYARSMIPDSGRPFCSLAVCQVMFILSSLTVDTVFDSYSGKSVTCHTVRGTLQS